MEGLMHDGRRSEDHSIGYIRKNWPLIAAVVTAISTGAVTISSVTKMDSAVIEHEKRLDNLEQAVQAVAPMKEDVNDLKQDVREIQRDIKEILRRVR